MNSLVPPSPPETITTSTLATSIMAMALSTAECTTSNLPLARPSRWALELSVNSNSSLMPCRAKKPFSTPTKNGSDRAVGKVLTRTRVSSAGGGAGNQDESGSGGKAQDFHGDRALGWRAGWFSDKTVGGCPLVEQPSRQQL